MKNLIMVKDKKSIINAVNFGLDWISDTDMRNMLYKHYYAWYLTWPNDNMQLQSIQHKADLIRDYFNELYETTIWREKYDLKPWDNYDRMEEWTDVTNATGKVKNNTKINNDSTADSTTSGNPTSTTTNYENPMGSGTEGKEVSHSTTEDTLDSKNHATNKNNTNSDSDTDSTNNTNLVHTGHMHGNIGTTMEGDIIKNWRSALLNITNEYLDQFKPCFMLSLLGIDGL